MSQSLRGEQTWIDAAADRFERQWNAGPDRPSIEDCLDQAEPNQRAQLLAELVRVECELRRARGEQPTPVEYLMRFPDDCAAVNAAFGGDDGSASARRPVSAAESLLFGLLALQNNFIDRNGLLAAFNDWVTDKTKPLGQILLDRGTLSPARYAVLEQLVQEHIAQHGCDPERSLAELRVVPEVRDRLEQVADLDLQCSLMVVSPEAVGGRQAEGSTTLDWLLEPEGSDAEGRFQIVRFHDRGNLGEVFLARDSQLHRIVALKRIKSAPAADQDKRAASSSRPRSPGGSNTRASCQSTAWARLTTAARSMPCGSSGETISRRPSTRFTRPSRRAATRGRAPWRCRSSCGGSWTCATRSPTRTAGAWCTAI